ncbi:hypothetical protein KAI87_09160, partial [Myxococcota bacterium]|nr:hypothetical protein [Myxococcota bacterium]
QSITKEPSADKKPAWINTLPSKSGYVFVVGISTRAKTLEEGKEKSGASAAAQVSSYVGAHIKSEFQMTSSTETGDTAKEEIEAATAAYVQSLQLLDTYHVKTTKIIGSFYEESYDVWVLERFPLSAAKAERERQAAEARQMAADGLQLLKTGRADLKAKELRDGWIALGQAKDLMSKLSGTTKVDADGYKNVAEVLRDIKKAFRKIDEQARGIQLNVYEQDGAAKNIATTLQTQLSQGFGKSDLILRKDSKARFQMRLDVSTKIGKRKTFGKTVGFITYTVNVTDRWSGASYPGTSGETKGFGSSKPAALNEAAKEAADKIVPALVKQLGEAMKKDLERE